MAERDQHVVGTITLDDFADPEFWLPQDDPEDALYVHRAVVARAVAGQRIGATLLNWASLRAEAAGRTWVRLDAWATNTQLQSYYLGQGWAHVRTLQLSHRGSGALFQRRAGTTTPGTPEITEVQ
jgi:GNAT superfamily N-acetyltransferase